MRASRVLGWILAVLAACGCTRTAPAEAVLTVDLGIRHQTIEGWGTSMMSWKLAETPYRDPAWRKAYRDLGLNILRVNMKKDVLVDSSGDMRVPVLLGASLAGNIAKMDFDHPKVRVFGEMAAWLRKNALEPERVRITAAIWSPPHWMKGPTGESQYHVAAPTVEKQTPWLSRGTKGDSIGGRLDQRPENLEQLGRYVSAWVAGFEQRYGVPIYALSIQNELSFENPFDSTTYFKGPGGEGKQWWQYANALHAVSAEANRQALRVKLIGPHVAHLGKRPDDPWGLWHQMSFIDAVKAHPNRKLIEALYAYNSNGYLGTDEGSVKMWAGYYRGKARVPAAWAGWTNAPGVEADGKPIWVSEAGGADGRWSTGEGDTPGNGAITVALKMHNALVHANASTYVYWQMSGTGELEEEHTLLGKRHISDPTRSKKYSAFKHFSRHVRPGAVRIEASFDGHSGSRGGQSAYDTEHALNASAYVHERDGAITVVFINMKPQDEAVQLVFRGGPVTPSLARYLTSENRSFAKLDDVRVDTRTAKVTIPRYSIVTLHGNLN